MVNPFTLVKRIFPKLPHCPRWLRLNPRLVFVGFGATSGVLAMEWAARFGFGLGRPPIYIADPATEYRLAPNQSLRRFGHRIDINQFGMRSEPMSLSRPTSQRRLLVIGDSVVWGGAQLDQRHIATELLRQPGLEVANLGIPSWGPANQLAFLQQYGTFDATDVVLVISSHDAADVPDSRPFMGIPDRPIRQPPSALAELIQRYGLPKLKQILPMLPWPSEPTDQPLPANGVDARALTSLDQLLTLLQGSGARLSAVQHWERDEIQLQPYPGHHAIAEVLKRHHIPVVQAGPLFRACGPMEKLYTDSIHPYTTTGQACLATAIRHAMNQAVTAATTPSP
ncbi:MAG: hypothetical protein VKN56_10715 [Cyanobacteriota bacterium]|nr:hypothetical protein [Cyanobacteriota bacterium]